MSWARDEFGTIALVQRLGQQPGASIPGACGSRAEILSAHAQASQAGIREHAVVLCLQDTTELDYNGQAMSGLGPLSYEAQRGLYLHLRRQPRTGAAGRH